MSPLRHAEAHGAGGHAGGAGQGGEGQRADQAAGEEGGGGAGQLGQGGEGGVLQPEPGTGNTEQTEPLSTQPIDEAIFQNAKLYILFI